MRPLLFFMLWTLASGDTEVVVVAPGEDITLVCQAPANVTLLTWSRRDLKPFYVFFYRDQREYRNFQHPSFRGRVQLKAPHVRGGDSTAILKNATVRDNGTYECAASDNGENPTVRKTVSLRVTEADGATDKHVIRIVGGIFSSLGVVVSCVCGVICKTRRRTTRHYIFTRHV